MLYAILCYNDENLVGNWTREEDDAVMARLAEVQKDIASRGKLGPVARLLPTSAATTLHKNGRDAFVTDGPFAETKEQFLGFYLVDCDNLEEALGICRDLSAANPGTGSYEIRPVGVYHPPGTFG